MALDPNQAAKIKHVTSLATRMAAELNLTIRYMSIDNGTINFYTTKDGSGTPAFSFNFPEELYLSQVGTTVVENFAWSALTYPNSNNPNLDGKVVLVLAVKGDATNPTVKYNFVDLSKLIDVYAPADKSITMSGHSIAVNISNDADNALELTNDGLMVDISGKVDKVANATQGNIAIFGASGAIANSGLSLADVTSVDVSGKVDKVTTAVAGNFAIFGQSGAIIDSGITFASDADVEAAFDNIFNPPTADGKLIATLTLTPNGNGGYTISYNGDGTLKTTNGTISGNTLSGITADGIVYADKTDNYTAVVCEFDSGANSTHTSYSGNVTTGKKIPTLTIEW